MAIQPPARGEIWQFTLRGVGSEMFAKLDRRGQPAQRRCLIVSRDAFNADGRVTVLPLQTHRRNEEDSEADDSSIARWAAMARWAASVRPYSKSEHEDLTKRGVPYEFELTARDGEDWDEKIWHRSIIDCGQLRTVSYTSEDVPGNPLRWAGPKAKLTDVALTNVETALHILLSPWRSFPGLDFQEGDIVEVTMPTETTATCVVVSCPAVDFLRENIWAWKWESHRRPFSHITVVPIEMGADGTDAKETAPRITLSNGNSALAICSEICTIDRRHEKRRVRKLMDPLFPKELRKVRQAVRVYLDLPTSPEDE